MGKMRITPRQKKEINFLSKTYHIKPTTEEIKQFFEWVVTGKNKDINLKESKNCLFQAKRNWDIQLKAYRENQDIFSLEELLKDFNHPYATKCIKKIYENRSE